MPAYRDEKTNKWYVQFYYTDWRGNRTKKKKMGFATKREAAQWESNFVNATNSSMSITMSEFIPIYFNDKKVELKERTIRNKGYMIDKYIMPYLGDKQMNKIQPTDIIKWQSIIQEMGFKPTYQRMVNNQLVAVFNHAERIYGLQPNPCKRVKKLGKSDADKLSFWTKSDFDKFISVIDKDKNSMYHLMFQILFWTGCREGELLALTTDDFDLEHNVVNIDKTYFRSEGKDFITEPKTESSVRKITIPQFLTDEIKAYISKLYKYPKDYRLFDITDRAVQKAMKKYIGISGVTDIRVHDLRHSHVAMLINEGVQPLLIKERLGHRDIRITLNTYGHLYPSQQEALAEMLNSKR
jgi:integrase